MTHPQGPHGLHRPQVPTPPPPGPHRQGPPAYPQQGYFAPAQGYPPHGYGYAAPPPVKATSHTRMLAVLAVALVVVAGAFVVISRFVTPAASTARTCTPNCGGPPPIGPAVAAKPTFTAADGSWSVEYPTGNPNFTSFKTTSSAVLADLGNGTAAILVQGGSAGGRSAQQVVQDYQQQRFPDARGAYEILHAEVGYNPGFGEVLDDFPQTTSGSAGHARLIVLATVRNDTYVLVAGYGPYQLFAKDGVNDGHPSGAASVVSFFMDPIINSVTWKGDPAR